MTFSWWSLWTILVVMMILPLLGYLFGFRGPYPHHPHKSALFAFAVGRLTRSPEAWRSSADFVWVVFLVSVFWALTALWGHW